MFPGSPFAPNHSLRTRIQFGAVGLLIGASSTFTNALVNVNVANLAGSLGLTLAQASVLPAIYVAMNATANLTLIRARAQFGIPQVTLVLLGAYALMALLLLLFPGYAPAIAVRVTCGLAAAGLTTLTIYYLMQIFPVKLRPLAIVIGISLPQLGTPFARLIPVEVLTTDNWHGLALIELGVALFVAAAILAVPLPPSERSKAFEPLDVLTIALMVPGFLLVCIVLGEGRLLWWSDPRLAGLGARLRRAADRRRHRHRAQPCPAAAPNRLARQHGHPALRRRRALGAPGAGRADLWRGRLPHLGRPQQRPASRAVPVRRARHGARCRGRLLDAFGAPLPFQVMAAALIIALGASSTALDQHHAAGPALLEPVADRLRHHALHRSPRWFTASSACWRKARRISSA